MAARWRSTSNSPELCGPIDEQLQIDPALLQQAFARGLRSGPEWLDRLEHAVGFDAELEADAPVVLGTLKLLRELIGRDWHRHSSEYSLFDLEDYVQGSITMTPRELIYRIGLLAHQLENASPTALARRESSGTNRSVRTQLSGTSKSDENEYEDDFDELDEDDNGALDEKLASVIDEDFSATAAYGEYAGSGKYGSGGAGGVSAGRGGSGKLGYNDEDTYEDSYQQGPGRAQQGRHSSSSLVRSSAPSYSRSPRAAQDQVVLPRSVSESKVSDSDAPLSERRSNNSAGGARKSKSSVTTWIRDKKYQLGVKIGSGSFGEVYQCMNHEGKLFAVKQLHIAGQRHAVDALANEIQLMREFRHVNIVRYIGAAVDEAEGVVNIFQEWVPGGSVAHMLKTFGPFPQRVVASYTRQILLGLSFLHKAGIIHRDIKGGNVLVHENGTVKLADFGASTRTDFDKTQETESIKGTPYFMAPEVLAESKYGRKGDIWAVGCTIIQMFTGQPPWKDRNLSTMVQLHLLLQNWNGPPTYPHESVSADCRAAIELCFQRDSAQRPSADTLLECAFLAAEDDLDKSWGSQQLGASGERFSHARSDSGSDDRDFKMGEDVDGDGDGDALGVSNTMRELKAKMTRVAGAGPGGIWRSMEATDNQDEPTEHVRRQLADRQRTKDREQRRQRHNDDDDRIQVLFTGGHNAGVPLSDEPLPPARYGTSPQLQKPSGQETNPYARGASRSKAREVKGEPAPAAASSQHRPSSRELGKAAEAKSETPRTTPSNSASTTPTRATGGNHLTPSTSPQRGEAPLNLRVATQRDQHHIVKTSAPGSRPSSKESSASLRGPGGPSPSTQQASNRRAPPHRYGGLSSARDTEELTPSPYPNDGQAEGVGMGEDEDEDELLVLEDQGWVCQFCFKINSAEQTSYCDFCAKTRKPTPLVKSYAQSEHK